MLLELSINKISLSSSCLSLNVIVNFYQKSKTALCKKKGKKICSPIPMELLKEFDNVTEVSRDGPR